MIFKNENFKCEINITENPLNLNIEDYLDMGLRNNKKRRFLFILKKLGKHLAIRPKDMDDLGQCLVKVYNYRANKNLATKHSKATVISFAETATALGYSVFKHLDENANEFAHTTRELDSELENYIEFLEEHSHATNHKLYSDNLKNIEYNDTIILVDDEITTAKTCVNIIKQLQEIYPNKNYVVFSILNWISKEREEEILQEVKSLGCNISFTYLFRGDFNFELYNTKEDNFSIDDNSFEKEINYLKLDFNNDKSNSYLGSKRYLKHTGRFGIQRSDITELNEILERESLKLNSLIDNEDEKILCLGTEEFMNIPLELASILKSKDVSFFATTRSPIISINDKNYPINSKINLNSSYDSNVSNYLYNIDKTKYDKCFIFLETQLLNNNKNIIDNISKNINSKNINVVTF